MELTNENIRLSRPGDEASLRQIWHDVFGDDFEYVDGFLDNAYAAGDAIVMDNGEKIVSMVFLLPIGKFVTPENKEGIPCTVSYAFATPKEFRSRGYGRKIANYAVGHSFDTGSYVNTIVPAEDSLFGYYEKNVDYTEYFRTNECELMREEITAAPLPFKKVSAAEYSDAREAVLADRAHVAFSERFLGYQHYLSARSGGAMFVFESGSVATAELFNNIAVVKELLCSDDEFMPALAAIAGACSAEKFFVRTPVKSDSEGRRFAMLKTAAGTDIETKSDIPAWYGFAFD